MTYDVHVRDAVSRQDVALRADLEGARPTFGAFSVAGYPDLRSGVETFVAFAQSGATVLEVGAPAVDPWLDGPTIAAAHHRALRGGDGGEHHAGDGAAGVRPIGQARDHDDVLGDCARLRAGTDGS